MFERLVPWKHRGRDVPARQEQEGHTLASFRRDFDQLWERFWDDVRHGALLESSDWSSNLEDREKEYVLTAELPGFEPEDFDIQVSGNVLTLRAEHKEEGQEKKGNGSYQRYGSFCETFTLPRGVLAERIEARYHSGVLEVHLPKSEECQAKRIQVKSAS